MSKRKSTFAFISEPASIDSRGDVDLTVALDTHSVCCGLWHMYEQGGGGNCSCFDAASKWWKQVTNQQPSINKFRTLFSDFCESVMLDLQLATNQFKYEAAEAASDAVYLLAARLIPRWIDDVLVT